MAWLSLQCMLCQRFRTKDLTSNVNTIFSNNPTPFLIIISRTTSRSSWAILIQDSITIKSQDWNPTSAPGSSLQQLTTISFLLRICLLWQIFSRTMNYVLSLPCDLELKSFAASSMKQWYDTTKFMRVLLPLAENREQRVLLTPNMK